MDFEKEKTVAELKRELLDTLRTEGPEHERSRELVQQWGVRRLPELWRLNNRDADIRFEIEQGDLYVEAGFPDIARGFFEDALYQAEQEGFDDLIVEIGEKLEKI